MSSWSRFVNVFRRSRLRREIDEEMASHIEEAISEGRHTADARRAFGSMLRHREHSQDVRLAAWLDLLRADVVFSWRQLRKHKAVSTVAILSLGLTMGACTSAFRLIDALLLRPLPVADPARLFILSFPYMNPDGRTETADAFDYPQFRALRTAVASEAELIAVSRPARHGLTFSSEDQTERFWPQSVSGWMFASLGLKPALGRLLTASDDVTPGAHPVAVLSHDYWNRRFGRDPGIIGSKFRYGTDVYEIVGVCEKSFTGTEPGMITDLFMPMMMNAKAIDNPNWAWFRIWARLKPGVTPEVARQKLRLAASAYRKEQVKTWQSGVPRQHIEEYTRAALNLEPASAGLSSTQREYRRPLVVLGVVVALVLWIACANVANLMTAQAAARSREMALRVSIGAGRQRLVQLVMVQSLLTVLLASLLGGLFAWWSAPFVITRINSPEQPTRLILPADWRVLGFAVGLALAVTLLFGLLPALRASAVQPVSALRGGEDPHSRRRLVHALIAVQVAFCVLVHVVTGLFVTTFDRLSRQPTGFVADQLLAVETVTRNNHPSRYWDHVRQHLQSLNGVESIAICSWALLSGNGWSDSVWANGQSPGNEEVYFLAVSPGWFHTMRIPLLNGRDFRPQDASEVAIVNEAFTRRYFVGGNPVGRSFEKMVSGKLVRSQIVGYVGDARYLNIRESLRPTVYVPFDAEGKGADWATFVVRTANPVPLTIAPTLRQEVTRARPEFRVVGIRTQTELVEAQTVRERLLAMLSLFLAVVALILAAVGLYGVLHYSVLQRRREIGIRIALGALPGEVARRVIAQVSAMLVLGGMAGLLFGLTAQRYLESLLYQVKATDLPMLCLPVVTTLMTALFAAVAPVLYAVRIDPAAMLRAE